MSEDLTFALVQEESGKFLKRMGWWRVKTPLESLALVAGEIGEAANECRGERPTEHFREEIADIVLRCFGIAAEEGFDLAEACSNKIKKWQTMEPGRKGRLK